MAKRDWPLMFTCGHEGCKEQAIYRYSTRRDMMESFELKNYTNGRWRCVRHTRPNEVLSASNLSTTHELTVEQRPYGKFFEHSGFVRGPGFKAFAADLPEGTRLVVTAQLILPSELAKHGGA